MLLYWSVLYPIDVRDGANNPKIVGFPFGHVWMCHLTPFVVGLINSSITKTVLKRDFNWLIVPFFFTFALIELLVVPSGAPQGIVGVWFDSFKEDPIRAILLLALLTASMLFSYRLMVYLDEKSQQMEKRQFLNRRPEQNPEDEDADN